ncbi:14066_t:CDS:2 [Funneliformis mosseae]|uniref:14066_t:CDS:1 n=1 Tax=Funneliformis mosseae TaxID=27381 RepID=A0A9N9GVG3_FUNMO|nr:14066_t:CDS:2 [Funneliformis mosseae]
MNGGGSRIEVVELVTAEINIRQRYAGYSSKDLKGYDDVYSEKQNV